MSVLFERVNKDTWSRTTMMIFTDVGIIGDILVIACSPYGVWSACASSIQEPSLLKRAIRMKNVMTKLLWLWWWWSIS